MNTWMKRCAAFLLVVILAFTSANVTGGWVETAYAATVQNITKSTQVVCKKAATVRAPEGYRNCKYSSSNPKVATVNSKGKLTALRLGVTTITVKSGSKQKCYTITVVPAKKNDVRLNQELIIRKQKVRLKLVSDKYDTSQVKLKFEYDTGVVSKSGQWKWNNVQCGKTYIRYSYGAFSKETAMYVCDKSILIDGVMKNDIWGFANTWAGVSYDTGSLQWEFFDDDSLSYKQLKNKGIEIQLDGKTLPDKIVYTPGEHTFTIIAGKDKYSQKVGISYSVKEALAKKDARGYAEDGKEVFDAAFAAVNQVIKDGMSEEEKVKAIHDYLIYNANYVNNGDYKNAQNWAYGAGGVLLHKEGVCQSYAIAFYMMAISAGLECKYVTGTANGGGHAWNQVKVNGKWYYIDCTWDDPVGGGYEGYNYYLSETLWSDHIEEETKDLAEDGKYSWEHYYLTGTDY